LGSGVLLQLFLQKSSVVLAFVLALIYAVFAIIANLIGMQAQIS
jgi:hypothetical protein